MLHSFETEIDAQACNVSKLALSKSFKKKQYILVGCPKSQCEGGCARCKSALAWLEGKPRGQSQHCVNLILYDLKFYTQYAFNC